MTNSVIEQRKQCKQNIIMINNYIINCLTFSTFLHALKLNAMLLDLAKSLEILMQYFSLEVPDLCPEP